MELDDYHARAAATAIYPNKGNNLVYALLGLCGESGELAEKMKKVIRDKSGVLDHETREAMIKELGDVLWYVSAAAFELGATLEDVATTNLIKLAGRKRAGTLGGSGDER